MVHCLFLQVCHGHLYLVIGPVTVTSTQHNTILVLQIKSVKLSPKAGPTSTHLYDMYMHIILHFLAVISYHVVLHIHDMYDIIKTCSDDIM